jgi:mRNA-degrading endonuclease RelE of RelBE toxin-antitoxin system
MSFEIVPSKYFLDQIRNLDEKSKRIIREKIELIRDNHYRNKKIHSKRFSRIFRVRLNINNKDKRLIYVILTPKIILACLIERDKNYKDLEKYLSKVFKN